MNNHHGDRRVNYKSLIEQTEVSPSFTHVHGQIYREVREYRFGKKGHRVQEMKTDDKKYDLVLSQLPDRVISVWRENGSCVAAANKLFFRHVARS